MAYKDYLGLLLPRKIKNSEVLDIVNTEKGQANGIASLNNSGQVPSSQLPSYVDDIVEYNNQGDFPLIGETGKIYCDVSTNKIYRWSGSNYVEIPPAYSNATTAVAGLMSTEDKIKINNLNYIADGTSKSVLLGNINYNVASGLHSVAEGNATLASGGYAHAEGTATTASGLWSHAGGVQTLASTDGAHAEGQQTTASGRNAHAEGYLTKATGHGSHVEGDRTTASGSASHAEGKSTLASGYASHADGGNTVASHRSQHVFGEWNIVDPSTADNMDRGNYIEIVGNGSGSNLKSNARTLDWNGNETLAGKLTVGADPTNNMEVVTKQYLDNLLLNSVPFITAETIILTVAGWNNDIQTVNMTGVTENSIIITTFAPASKTDYVTADITCTAQGAGTLTFSCSTTPSTAIAVIVLVINDTSSLVDARGVNF